MNIVINGVSAQYADIRTRIIEFNEKLDFLLARIRRNENALLILFHADSFGVETKRIAGSLQFFRNIKCYDAPFLVPMRDLGNLHFLKIKTQHLPFSVLG